MLIASFICESHKEAAGLRGREVQTECPETYEKSDGIPSPFGSYIRSIQKAKASGVCRWLSLWKRYILVQATDPYC